jgi:hypothetical protein
MKSGVWLSTQDGGAVRIMLDRLLYERPDNRFFLSLREQFESTGYLSPKQVSYIEQYYVEWANSLVKGHRPWGQA